MCRAARAAAIGVPATRQTRTPPRSRPVTEAWKPPGCPAGPSGVIVSGMNARLTSSR
jgi:hypothetical protein